MIAAANAFEDACRTIDYDTIPAAAFTSPRSA